MPIDETKLNEILTAYRTKSPQVAEVLRVDWSDSVVKYYANSQFDEIPPFRGVANYCVNNSDVRVPIEARLIHEGFLPFEKNADLSTENISITFADTDSDIIEKFQTYGEGVRCELFYYYPQQDLFTSEWWGSLELPTDTGRGNLTAQATNGFRTREQPLPNRFHPIDVCHAKFGGEIAALDEFNGNGCPYNRHLSGSIGNLNSGVPFTQCPKTKAACIARLGAHANGEPKYFQGFSDETGSVATDANNPNYLASAKGNASKLKDPIPVVLGAKHLHDLPNLFFRNENNASNPSDSWVRGIWEIGETCEQIDLFTINGKVIEPLHLAIRNGELGQPPLPFSANISGMSGTALAQGAFGYTPANTPLSSFSTFIRVPKGYNKIRVYTDTETYTEIWTDNRAWCLLELYTNLRFGRGYLHEKFHIQDFIDVADWLDTSVRFSVTDSENTTTDYDYFRDKLGIYLTARPAQEQIIDICRAGRISVPFQYDSKYSIAPLKAVEDLEECRVFTDKGQNRNIVWQGTDSIRFSQIPDSKLTNTVVLTYEEENKRDKEVPLTFKDEAQIEKARLSRGDNGKIEKRFVATGVRNRKIATKLGFALLYFGEFDTGGTLNNLRAEFNCIYEQTLGLKKFDVIKLESDLLENYDFEYFRVLSIKKDANHIARITAQAYNAEYYETFETEIDPITPPPIDPPPPPVCVPTFGSIGFNNGLIEIPIEPCT